MKNSLALFNVVRRSFLLFQVLAQHHRYSAGADELTVEDLAARLKLPHEDVRKAVAILTEAACIEIASISPKCTKYRFVPGSTAPDEIAVQTSARK